MKITATRPASFGAEGRQRHWRLGGEVAVFPGALIGAQPIARGRRAVEPEIWRCMTLVRQSTSTKNLNTFQLGEGFSLSRFTSTSRVDSIITSTWSACSLYDLVAFTARAWR